MRWWSCVMLWSVLVILVVLVASGVFDRRFIYYPTPWEPGDWARRSQLPLEDVWCRTSDGVRIHGWLVEAPASPAVALLCHGNAGNIMHRLSLLQELHRRGLSVCIFDYRGYGQSQGTPTEPGLYRDAQAVYEYLTTTRHVPPSRLIVWGTSLGAAVAGELAAQQSVAGVILETPFPSVRAMARAYYGALPMHWLLRARYALARRLKRVHVPVLVMHGDRDRLVPLALGRDVYAAANEPKFFYVIPGADHNDTYDVGGEDYFHRVLAFIRQTTAGP